MGGRKFGTIFIFSGQNHISEIVHIRGWKLIWIWESLRRLENTSNGDDVRGIFTSCAVLGLRFLHRRIDGRLA